MAWIQTGNIRGTTGATGPQGPAGVTGATGPSGANVKGFVNHGTVASTARPSGYASIEWYGSATPANAQAGDTWIDTT